jgi:CheY-like chemotaxis protein
LAVQRREGPEPLVLVVDDDPAVRSLLRQLMEDQGYRTQVAENGQEALELARRERPDCILMDLMMPVLDGPSAIQELRNDPDLSRVPIVVVSVLSEERGGQADAHLVKPIDQDRLADTVAMLLDRHQQACDHTMLLGRGETPEAAQLLLCPGAMRTCTPEDLPKVVEQGFRGTVLLTPAMHRELDLETLSALPGLQVVLLPEPGDS